MPDDKGAEAAAARASRLREQIGRIESGPGKASTETRDVGTGSGEPATSLSPRDFVEKRMRELDSKT